MTFQFKGARNDSQDSIYLSEIYGRFELQDKERACALLFWGNCEQKPLNLENTKSNVLLLCFY